MSWRTSSPTSWAKMRRSRPGPRSRRRWTRALQELARATVERGLEELDARQGYRGPSGHVTGKALDSQRRELGRTVFQVPQGLRHRRGDRPALREGRDQSARSGSCSSTSARASRRMLPAPRPEPTGKGKLAQKLKAPPPPPLPPPAREGFVDFSLEPRYAKGTKPLADRFKPGDLVRVRLRRRAPATRRTGRCRSRSSSARRRRWWCWIRRRARCWRWWAATTTTRAASTARSGRAASRGRRSSRSSTAPRSRPAASRRPRSSTTRPRCTTCGSRRTTRRRSSAARSACAPRSPTRSTRSRSRCCRTSDSIRHAPSRRASG